MKRKENGFAATGILYTILLVFLVLMSTLLVTLSSRSRVLDKLKNDAKDMGEEEKYGIPIKEYTQGEEVEYLGYTWLVMRDYGKSTRLLLKDHLSTEELKLYLPSDVSSSNVSDSGIPMCINNSNYCPDGYSYKTSIIKATVENWLEQKMKDNNLSEMDELEEMQFTDGSGVISSYVRIPLAEEDGLTRSVISEVVTINYGGGNLLLVNGCKYSPLLDNKTQDNDLIATLTRSSDSEMYTVLPFTGDGYCNDGKSARYRLHASQVMPIITVKES